MVEGCSLVEEEGEGGARYVVAAFVKNGGVKDELDDDEEQNDDAEEGQIDAEGEREVESAVVDESEEKETLCLCRK